jgi:hypothetical protein
VTEAGAIETPVPASTQHGQGVGDLEIARRIGEGRGSVIDRVHHSPAKIWAAMPWSA